jgi:hypothetical protein
MSCELLQKALEAHGGLDRWRCFATIQATIVTGGQHDYHVEASGGFAAAQYVFNSVTVQGITLPRKRRAYMRDERLLPIHDRLMVSIDLSEISFS